MVATNRSGAVNDAEVLEFYNLATGKLLRGLEVSLNSLNSVATFKVLRS